MCGNRGSRVYRTRDWGSKMCTSRFRRAVAAVEQEVASLVRVRARRTFGASASGCRVGEVHEGLRRHHVHRAFDQTQTARFLVCEGRRGSGDRCIVTRRVTAGASVWNGHLGIRWRRGCSHGRRGYGLVRGLCCNARHAIMLEKAAHSGQVSAAITNTAKMTRAPKSSVTHVLTQSAFDVLACGRVREIVLPFGVSPVGNIEDGLATSAGSLAWVERFLGRNAVQS
jgi:hypothetical protein